MRALRNTVFLKKVRRTMCNKPSLLPISGDNLSYAWANAFIKCFETSGRTLSPSIVSFPAADSNGNIEIPEIRSIVESQLQDPSKVCERSKHY